MASARSQDSVYGQEKGLERYPRRHSLQRRLRLSYGLLSLVADIPPGLLFGGGRYSYGCVTTYVTRTLKTEFLTVTDIREVRTHWEGVQTK
jgi:hypothetical protein